MLYKYKTGFIMSMYLNAVCYKLFIVERIFNVLTHASAILVVITRLRGRRVFLLHEQVTSLPIVRASSDFYEEKLFIFLMFP